MDQCAGGVGKEEQGRLSHSTSCSIGSTNGARPGATNIIKGRAVLQSPDLACLQFQKYKVDADGKPLFVTGKDGKPKMPNLEPEPSERIVCTGK